jgi:hypothetical protein
MRTIVSVILVFSLALWMTGCATIFKGSTDAIGVNSNPSGARVYADGAEVCSSTPCEVKLKSNKSWNILIKMDGYKEKTVMVSNSVGAIWIILDILAGLVPIIIDAATGSWYHFDRNMVTVTLEKE